jgi:molybdopterin molybdotransferase
MVSVRMTMMPPTIVSQPAPERSPPTALITVADARARVLREIDPPALATESVPLAAALGRILACDLTSPVAVPPWPNSAMDGYAVRRDDLPIAGPAVLPISQWIPAGTAAQPLEPGTAARIFTGAPIPFGADAVVMQERCAELDGRVRIDGQPEAGSNIRAAGEDTRMGAEILHAGQRLAPQHIGLAASVGYAAVDVQRPLRVAVLTTGDEIVPQGQTLGPGQIYDSNGPMLTALLCRLGCELTHLARVPDTHAATIAALADAEHQVDLILTSGGVSVGEEDHVRAAVESLGALSLWRIAIKPGKPLAFGRVGATPFIGLPGNPVSLFVTFLLFAAPAIRRMQHRRHPVPAALPVPAGFEVVRTSGRDEYVRVRLEDGRLRRYPNQGSGVLSSTCWADGLAVVPAGTTVTAGDPLDYLPLHSMLD